jgi:septal ring factor EnvC (AmiA/AmiB activator)
MKNCFDFGLQMPMKGSVGALTGGNLAWRQQTMAEANLESILEKVREYKKIFDEKAQELELANNELNQAKAELSALQQEIAPLRQQVADKDEAIHALLAQNQEIQDAHDLLNLEFEQLSQQAKGQNKLLEELNALL